MVSAATEAKEGAASNLHQSLALLPAGFQYTSQRVRSYVYTQYFITFRAYNFDSRPGRLRAAALSRWAVRCKLYFLLFLVTA
jgi:hypothetical protein